MSRSYGYGTDRNCKNCRYWNEFSHVRQSTLDGPPDIYGSCHRYPGKTAAEVGMSNIAVGQERYVVWPETAQYNWCGEHRKGDQC